MSAFLVGSVLSSFVFRGLSTIFSWVTVHVLGSRLRAWMVAGYCSICYYAVSLFRSVSCSLAIWVSCPDSVFARIHCPIIVSLFRKILAAVILLNPANFSLPLYPFTPYFMMRSRDSTRSSLRIILSMHHTAIPPFKCGVSIGDL